jgi:EAL domain-containing protein (putative c-di-GMP-specific phosphodiesterase class I)
VAEGVETEAEASVMRLIGVTELQGFYFSQAVPVPEMDALLAVQNAPAAGAKSTGQRAKRAL